MAYTCQHTDPQSGVIAQSDNVDFMKAWVESGRRLQAEETRDREILSKAGAKYSQIRNAWFKQVGEWDSAQEAKLIVLGAQPNLQIGDTVGIWDCYSKSSRYLSLWTVTKVETFWKTYELKFKQTIVDTSASQETR